MARPTVYWTDADSGPPQIPRAAWLAAVAVIVAIAGYVLIGVLAPKYPAALTITPSASDRTVVIDGQTDLPDGSVVSYELIHELRYRQLYPDRSAPPTTIAPSQSSTPQIVTGSMKVADGRFDGIVSLGDWPPGTVHVSVSFDPDPEQPPEVRAKFGDKNEHLGGSNVAEDSDGLRFAVAKATVSLP
jgi:hypothetical protein